MNRQPNGRNLTPEQDRLLTELIRARSADLGDRALAAEFARQTGRRISDRTVEMRRWETPGAWVPDPANHVARFEELAAIPDDPDAAEVERRRAELDAEMEAARVFGPDAAKRAAIEKWDWRQRRRFRHGYAGKLGALAASEHNDELTFSMGDD